MLDDDGVGTAVDDIGFVLIDFEFSFAGLWMP